MKAEQRVAPDEPVVSTELLAAIFQQFSVTTTDEPVVETAPLASVLEEFVVGWRSTRPSLKGRRGLPDNALEPFSPYEWIVEESRGRDGVTPLSVDDLKAIYNPIPPGLPGTPRPRPETVSFAVADALVACIGRPELFYDGTLTVRDR